MNLKSGNGIWMTVMVKWLWCLLVKLGLTTFKPLLKMWPMICLCFVIIFPNHLSSSCLLYQQVPSSAQHQAVPSLHTLSHSLHHLANILSFVKFSLFINFLEHLCWHSVWIKCHFTELPNFYVVVALKSDRAESKSGVFYRWDTRKVTWPLYIVGPPLYTATINNVYFMGSYEEEYMTWSR